MDSRLEKLESRGQTRNWNFYKIIWKLENFSVFFNIAKFYKETKNKNDTDPNLAREFCSTAFLSKPYGYSFFIRTFPYGRGPALGKSMSITISVVSGPFEDILTWLFKGTIQISVFRQDNFALIWTNLLKTNEKTTPCLSRPSLLQSNPSFGVFFYLPHEEKFKTDKNLIKNECFCSKKTVDFL